MPLVTIQLGPDSVVSQALPDLEPGQYVTVTGVPVRWHGNRVLVAEQVQMGRQVVAFRGPNGAPMWAGGWQGWSTGVTTAGAPMIFNPATIATISGQIMDISTAEIAPGMGQDSIVHLQTADGQDFWADLGPPWFLQQAGLPQLQPGQQFTVTGSLVTIANRPTLLATSVQYAGRQYSFRTAAGAPMWVAVVVPPGQAATVIAQAPSTTVVSGAVPQTMPSTESTETESQETTENY